MFAVAFLWLTSFGASWGQILHTEHLVALHLLVLAAAPSGRGDSATAGWPLKVMSAVTVATYFVAGVAKLRFGGGLDWLDGDGLLRLVAHDNLRKRLLGDTWSPISPFAVGHPLIFQIGAWLTLVVELGAPLALLGRRWAYTWVALAWSFPPRRARPDGRAVSLPAGRCGVRLDVARRAAVGVASGGLVRRVRGYRAILMSMAADSPPDVVVHRVLPIGRHRSLDDYVAAGGGAGRARRARDRRRPADRDRHAVRLAWARRRRVPDRSQVVDGRWRWRPTRCRRRSSSTAPKASRGRSRTGRSCAPTRTPSSRAR